MSKTELFTDGITAHQVRQILRLEPNPSGDDHGAAKGLSMYDKQVQGITTLYNLLCAQPVAYLADEVGMGKTYQALGLACLLWNLEPAARVMVVAPRGNVQRKWEADYTTFLQNNYLLRDDRVKDCLLGRPVREPVVCENLTDLVGKLVRDADRFFVLRLTSFMRPVIFSSGQKHARKVVDDKRASFQDMHFHPQGDLKDGLRTKTVAQDEAKQACMAWTGAAVNQSLPEIDLLIVDEAQNLRHRENQSCTNFRRVFGLYQSRAEWDQELGRYLDLRKYLGCEPRTKVRRLLLLSATPAHSQVGDISSQLRYGLGLEHGDRLKNIIEALERSGNDVRGASEALKHVMVRRFRMFGPLNKYGYRQEEAPVMQVEQDPLAELSTALVTKHLYRALKGKGNRFRVGFLSSFESLQQSIKRQLREDEDGPEGIGSHTDEEGQSLDAGFISRLDEAFVNKFGVHLVHPKQRYVVDQGRRILDAEHTSEVVKMLVFVRRLATVGEIVRDISAVYDEILGRRVAALFDIEPGQVNPARLESRLQEMRTGDDADEQEIETESPELQEPGRTSQYLDLFRSKDSAGGWFRRLFNQGRSLWWFFDENWARTLWWLETGRRIPLEEYLRDRDFSPSEARAAYPARHEAFYLAQLEFAQKHRDLDTVRSFLRQRYAKYVGEFDRSDDASRDARLLLRTSFWNELLERGGSGYASFLTFKPAAVSEEDLYAREQTKAWISKNLRMSEPIVDLAAAYRAASGDPESLVEQFVSLVADQPKLVRRLELLTSHAPLIERTLGYDLQADRYERLDGWAVFDDQNPVRGVLGGSGNRDTVTRQFNTPFFPDVIVCTDVLREGVDLHLFCDYVMHYGLAFSPGDIEQRTGRIDRYFSKTCRAIEGSPGHEERLCISFPYLASTLDELQLARVLSRRNTVQNLMDQGLPVPRFDPEISTREKADQVKSLLLERSKDLRDDPFPATNGWGTTTVVVSRELKGHDEARALLRRLLDHLRTRFDVAGDVDSFLEGRLDQRLFRLTLGIQGNRLIKKLAVKGEPGTRWQSVQVSLDFASQYRTHVLKARSWITEDTQCRQELARWLESARDSEVPPFAVGVAVMLQDRKSSKRQTLNSLVAQAAIPFTRENDRCTVDGEELVDMIERVALTADYYEELVLEGDRNAETKWR